MDNSTCGNSVQEENEECDFGKDIEYDGCTNECLIEDNFVCHLDTNPMICSYNGSFTISQTKYEK